MTGGWIVYGIPFLVNIPDYECFNDITSRWESCTSSDICDGEAEKLKYKSEWRINYSGENTFYNWVDPDKLNLICVS